MKLQIQRLFPTHPGTRWKTMHRFDEEDALTVLSAAAQMGSVGVPIEFRVVTDDDRQSRLLHWSVRHGWIDHPAESPP